MAIFAVLAFYRAILSKQYAHANARACAIFLKENLASITTLAKKTLIDRKCWIKKRDIQSLVSKKI